MLEKLGPEHFRNAEPARASHQFKGVAGLQRARHIHRQVKTTVAVLGHEFARMGKTHGGVEFVTGLARLRDTQGTVGKLQRVADPHLRLKQTGQAQVFPRAAPGQGIVDAAETGVGAGLAPERVMFTGVGVNRFIEATMHRALPVCRLKSWGMRVT